jgi:hypothetical protein
MNRIDSLYSEDCFEIENCSLGFICDLVIGIWDLTKFILEKKKRLISIGTLQIKSVT